MVKGSVTISIEDFQAMLDTKIDSDKKMDHINLFTKELQVFLSWICSREDIEKHVEEFNTQSKSAKITIEDGRAKIKINDYKRS